MFDAEVAELAAKRSDVAETFLRVSSTTPVTFQANKLKSLETKEGRSLTLRLLKGGRIGIASTGPASQGGG